MAIDLGLVRPARAQALSRRWLADHRRATIAWSLSLVGIIAMQLSVYPTIKSQPGLSEMYSKLPDAMKAMLGMKGDLDFSSGPGYLRGEIFGFTIPLLFLVFGIGAGAAVIAGDEEKGTLGLVLAQPVRRARVVLERYAASVVDAAVLATMVFLTIAIEGPLVGLHVSTADLLFATAATMLLGVIFGAIALAVGAATGHRGLALGAGAGVAVVAYLLDSLANLTDVLEPFRFLSPFHWAAPADIVTGGPVTGLVWLVAVSLAFVAIAAVAFGRRDVR